MHAFVWLLIFVASLWVVELADALANLNLDQYGIVPRDTTGLRGIPLHIFLHGGFGHLISNTGPLIVLGRADFVAGEGPAVLVVGVHHAGGRFDGVAGGGADYGVRHPHWGERAGVRIFRLPWRRGTFHERSFSSIFIAIVVIVFYGGGILLGLLPTDERVSWEGHLFGLLAGITYAGMVGRQASGG